MSSILPAVRINRSGGIVTDLAAFHLKSILKQDLLTDTLVQDETGVNKLNAADPVYLQQLREAFLHAISCWPSAITCEMHDLQTTGQVVDNPGNSGNRKQRRGSQSGSLQKIS